MELKNEGLLDLVRMDKAEFVVLYLYCSSLEQEGVYERID